MDIKRLSIALFLVSLLTFATVFAYYVSNNHPYQERSSSHPSPTSTELSSPPITPTSTYSHFEGPLGGFAITSPSNKTYSSDTLTLFVRGEVLTGKNVELFMTYSLDGQERLLIPVEAHPSHLGVAVTDVFNGSVTLQRLSEGSHSITVFGELEGFSGHHRTQAAVYFTVQGS
jgi:hypothetical protein